MLKVLYFAYGSNIDINRLIYRVGDVKVHSRYTLEKYRLVFNAGFKSLRKSKFKSLFKSNTFANIEPSEKGKVEGILYELTPEQFDILDSYEGLYERQYFQVSEKEIGCVYIAKHTTKGLPNIDYLDIIINGCKTFGLNKTVIKLQTFKENNYKKDFDFYIR